MLSYCLKCRKNTESKRIKSFKNKSASIKFAVCGSQESRFIEKQKAKVLLSITCKIQLIGPLLI